MTGKNRVNRYRVSLRYLVVTLCVQQVLLSMTYKFPQCVIMTLTIDVCEVGANDMSVSSPGHKTE